VYKNQAACLEMMGGRAASMSLLCSGRGKWGDVTRRGGGMCGHCGKGGSAGQPSSLECDFHKWRATERKMCGWVWVCGWVRVTWPGRGVEEQVSHAIMATVQRTLWVRTMALHGQRLLARGTTQDSLKSIEFD
jgi:hypothetical protein